MKPYLPYFEPYADEYVGVDIGNPAADIEGSVEALPVEDGNFNLVLCTPRYSSTSIIRVRPCES